MSDDRWHHHIPALQPRDLALPQTPPAMHGTARPDRWRGGYRPDSKGWRSCQPAQCLPLGTARSCQRQPVCRGTLRHQACHPAAQLLCQDPKPPSRMGNTVPRLCGTHAPGSPRMLEPGTGGQAARCRRAALPAGGRAGRVWGLRSWHAWLTTEEKTPAWCIPDITEIRGTWYRGRAQPGARLEGATGHHILPRVLSPRTRLTGRTAPGRAPAHSCPCHRLNPKHIPPCPKKEPQRSCPKGCAPKVQSLPAPPPPALN